MQTTSVIVQSLCIPCMNRCRYCLLSWNGHVEGADWDRSVRLAERYLHEIREQKPEVISSFAFGYAMDHPRLREAIRTCRRLGSPMADYLQCDGMKMRDDAACGNMMHMLRSEGVQQLNFTVYGLADYHDRFAGRKGDFALLTRMMRAARTAGLPFTAGIPLLPENIGQADELIGMLKSMGSAKIILFIPHEEGRGKALAGVRLSRKDLACLSRESRALLNHTLYRTEGEWLKEANPVQETRRQILIALRPENIEGYEKRSALSVVGEIEALDDAYYAAFPDFRTLAETYGDPAGEKLYRIRDLFYHYRLRYAQEHPMSIYDVTDERQSGSRRF